MTSETRTIKSDETVIRILRTLADPEGMKLVEIAEKLNLANSTVHNHLYTLRQHGFVAKRGGKYHLGLRFLDFGIQAREALQFHRVAAQKMEKAATETGEKVWAVVEENGEAVILSGVTGHQQDETFTRPGRHTGLHHLAAGKAILAHLPEHRQEEILSSTPFQEKTEHTITQRGRMEEELEEIRSNGFAINNEETMIGVRGIGVPVKRQNEGVYGGLSVSGPVSRLSRESSEREIVDSLRGIANEIEISIIHQEG